MPMLSFTSILASIQQKYCGILESIVINENIDINGLNVHLPAGMSLKNILFPEKRDNKHSKE